MARSVRGSSFGVLTQDCSGLYHYRAASGCHIAQALADALRFYNDGSVADRVMWFWFNGTFAPIHRTDTAERLEKRWERWRTAYQEGTISFLDILEEESKVRE